MPASKIKASAKKTPTQNKSQAKLAKLGLRTDMDLALHLPMRYEDETKLVTIQEAAQYGAQTVQVEGVVQSIEAQYQPRRRLIVTITDGTDQLVMRFLNFYASQITQLAEGTRVRVRGELKHGFFGAEMIHPTYKVVSENTPLPTALTPVYPAGEGLSQAYLRKAISNALNRIDWRDTLPDDIIQTLQLIAFKDAIKILHNPPIDVAAHTLMDRTHPAWTRVKLDELLAQQLSLKRAQQARRDKNAAPLTTIGDLSHRFLSNLPFTLTAAQQRVVNEIQHDLKEPFPMQRLLQGDVGSGKTVVAAIAAMQAIDSGFQAAIMAPTEILAEQHYRKMQAWLTPLGIEVAWLTGSLKKKEKLAALASIESGQARLIVGTHALIQDDVLFEHLGLVIVDEQHRFGVDQRLTLRNKAFQPDANTEVQQIPHQLMMSATPIPRTLAMTYYADIEVSVIDELPPGRSPIVTRTVDQQRRDEVIDRVHAAAQEGKQIYWVCPLIEESEALQLQTATDTYDTLVAALPDLSIGLLHGKMKPAEKQAVMEAFSQGNTDILVATTVIEVGVDVPNASLMVIEHAERFGLSQLHQLRGRVGRGSVASACLLLFQSPLGRVAKERLMIMKYSNDGFEIARRDLEIRGPGDFLGARQSGEAMLRFADLNTDQWLVEKARDLASQLLHTRPDVVENHLQRWLGGKEDYLKV